MKLLIALALAGLALAQDPAAQGLRSGGQPYTGPGNLNLVPCVGTTTTNCSPRTDANGNMALPGSLSVGNTVLGPYVVGTPTAGQIALPSAASAANKIYSVIDCESTSECATGGGNVPAFLRSNGSMWAIASGAGGGSQAQVQGGRMEVCSVYDSAVQEHYLRCGGGTRSQQTGD